MQVKILAQVKIPAYVNGNIKMQRRSDEMILTIRVPKDVHRRIKSQAKKNGRSINAEVLAILETTEAAPLLEELRGLVEAGRKK
jgi:Antitoxin FitA-like, ribbon-helix-helix